MGGPLSDVILCGHSYGGNVISGLADQVPERIRTLVYLDAFVPEDGESLFDLHSPEGGAQQMRLQAQMAGDGWIVPPIPAERFNVDPRDADWVNAQCRSQAIATFEEPIRLNRVPHHAHDITHILATGWDNSPFRAAHERAKRKGWKTRTVACGHEVMLDLPGEATDLLLEFTSSGVPSSLTTRPIPREAAKAL
jgi:pimeloyl-ACP methyl ester carboxylesterase